MANIKSEDCWRTCEPRTSPFVAAEYLTTPERVAAYIAETDAEMAELRAENARLRARLADYVPSAFSDEELAILAGPRPSVVQLASLFGRSPNRYDKCLAASVEQATIDARQYGYVGGCVKYVDVGAVQAAVAPGWTDGVLSGRVAEPRNNDHEQDGA